jgi:hypothetical protein
VGGWANVGFDKSTYWEWEHIEIWSSTSWEHEQLGI